MTSHRVGRARIEVTTAADAADLGRRTEAVARGAITRLLDVALDQFDRSPDLVQIDRLELDLGVVPESRLEQALPEAFARALAAALARVTARDRPGTSADALVALARTGRAPWWHGPAEPAETGNVATPLLERAVAELLDDAAPARVADLLRALAQDPAARDRLAARLDDETFAAVLDRLIGDDGILARRLDDSLATTLAGRVLGPAGRLFLVRQALLSAAAGQEVETLEVRAEARLAALLAGDPSDARRDTIRPPTGSVQATLLAAAGLGGWSAPLLHALAPLAARLPDPSPVLTAIGALGATASAGRVAALLRPFLDAGLLEASALQGDADPLRSEVAAALTSLRPAFRLAPLPAPVTPGVTESIPVADAGISLLWPFLPGFFDGLGLLDPERLAWHDPAAAHRAATLLDHLATGFLVVDEARLAFAKLLCGIPPDTVHLADRPLAPGELAAAESFLLAMLDRLRPLGHLSVAGLRASWLLRPALLSQRDGLPLLRIERRPYDLLLDRLSLDGQPWPLVWVRLPWMPAPLRVEW